MLNIPLSKISLDFQKYQISSTSDFDSLKEDINLNGLFIPVVVSSFNNSYHLISGFKRFRIFSDLKLDTIPAVIKNFKSDDDVIVFIINDNLRFRNLFHSEIMNAVDKLKNIFNFDYNKISNILKIPEGYCKNYYLMNNFEERLIKFFDKEKLFIRLVHNYFELLNRGMRDFIYFMAENKINNNTQKNIITFIKEILLRDNISVKDLYNIINFYEIKANSNYDIYQKKDIIYKRLYNLRFPNISVAKEKFDKLLSKYVSKSKIKLSPPSNFEGDYINLEIKLKKDEEITYIIKTLKKMYEDKIISYAINTFV